MTNKEKIIEILHEHTRQIITDGKNNPLLRRAIKSQTADQILDITNTLCEKKLREQREEVKKMIRKKQEEPMRTLTPDNPQYDLGWNASKAVILTDILEKVAVK